MRADFQIKFYEIYKSIKAKECTVIWEVLSYRDYQPKCNLHFELKCSILYTRIDNNLSTLIFLWLLKHLAAYCFIGAMNYNRMCRHFFTESVFFYKHKFIELVCTRKGAYGQATFQKHHSFVHLSQRKKLRSNRLLSSVALPLAFQGQLILKPISRNTSGWLVNHWNISKYWIRALYIYI